MFKLKCRFKYTLPRGKVGQRVGEWEGGPADCLRV
jgi:hypothetical protein